MTDTAPRFRVGPAAPNHALPIFDSYGEKIALVPLQAPARGGSAAQAATARLLASAPELLDLLQRVYEGEYGFGSWPAQAEVADAIEHATGLRPG